MSRRLWVKQLVLVDFYTGVWYAFNSDFLKIHDREAVKNMKCIKCGNELRDTANFCTSCGTRVPRCPTCGKALPKAMRFCTSDGTRIPDEILALFPEEPAAIPAIKPETTAPVVQDPVPAVQEDNWWAVEPDPAPGAEPAFDPDEDMTVAMSDMFAGQPVTQEPDWWEAASQPAAPQPEPIPEPIPAPIPAPAPVYVPQPKPVNQHPVKKKSGSALTVVLAVILSLLIMALIGMGIYMVLNGGLFDTGLSQSQKDDRDDDRRDPDDEEETDDVVHYETAIETTAPFEEPTEEPTEEITEAPTEEPTEALSPEEAQLLNWMDKCDNAYMTEADLAGMSAENARLARNAIFAKSGRKFTSEDLQIFFSQFAWYVPRIEPDNFVDSMLNAYQIHNRDLIVAYEQEQGYR